MYLKKLHVTLSTLKFTLYKHTVPWCIGITNNQFPPAVFAAHGDGKQAT